MQANRRQRKQNIARLNRLSINYLFTIDHTDDEAGDVVLACVVEARHLSRLSTEQNATDFPATVRNSFNDICHNICGKFSSGNVVKKEERTCALDQDIVDTVIDEIATNRVVDSSCEGDF